MGAVCRLRASRRGSVRAGTALGTALVLVLGAGGPASSGAPVDRRRDASGAGQGCLDPVLPAPARGDAAVRALGANVISVAARNGTNPRDLATQLHEDRTLWVDECGALLLPGRTPCGPRAGTGGGIDGGRGLASHDRRRGGLRAAQPPRFATGFSTWTSTAMRSRAARGTPSTTRTRGQPHRSPPTVIPRTFSASERSVVIDVLAPRRPGLRAVRHRRHHAGPGGRGHHTIRISRRAVRDPGADQPGCDAGAVRLWRSRLHQCGRPDQQPRLLPAGLGLPPGRGEQREVHRGCRKPRGGAQLRPQP